MEFLKKLAKLIDVKSIMSLAMTFVFCYLSLRQVLSPELFISIFSIVIGFYFGTQYSKVSKVLENNDKEEK